MNSRGLIMFLQIAAGGLALALPLGWWQGGQKGKHSGRRLAYAVEFAFFTVVAPLGVYVIGAQFGRVWLLFYVGAVIAWLLLVRGKDGFCTKPPAG